MTSPSLTVREVRARAVDVPQSRPLQHSGGEIPTAPLVLVDLVCEEGVVGRTYLFAYARFQLLPLARLMEELGALVAGRPAAPAVLAAELAVLLRIPRPQGLSGMAVAGIDMAAWDALARAAGLPLVRLLGGEPRPIPAYGSLKTMRFPDALREAEEEAARGFGAWKIKVGHSDPAGDLEAVRALRKAVGEEAAVAVDYNQSLTVPEAIRRARLLEDEHLLWIEEPTRADDFAGHARIRREVATPIQAGESWWGTADMRASLRAGGSDLAMPDVMRIGGVSGWLRAAGLAEAEGIPLSSHLFPEVSAHLLAVAPTAHYLEHLDVASPVLAEPLEVREGHALVPDRPGSGIDWDEGAVGRHRVG